MRNWHQKIIKLQKARDLIEIEKKFGNTNIFIGVLESHLEFQSLINNNDINKRFSPTEYKPMHIALYKDKMVFNREIFVGDTFSEDLYFNKINKNGLEDDDYSSFHATCVSGIIAGNIIDKSFIEGICPRVNLINHDGGYTEFQNIVGMGNIGKNVKNNMGSNYFITNSFQNFLIKTKDDGTTEIKTLPINPEVNSDVNADYFCSIINASISWKIDSNNQNQISPKSIDFILKELFAYGRNGRGILFINSSGNDGLGYAVEDKRPFNLSKKTIVVGASKVKLSLNRFGNYETENPIFDESHSDYSNYGKRLDLCAPSGSDKDPSKDDINIYSSTVVNGGDIGLLDDDYESYSINNIENNIKLTLIGNDSFLFPGQAIELGDSNKFWHEIRYIKTVEKNRGVAIVELDSPINFTKNTTINGVNYSLQANRAKVLVYKKNVDKVASENNKITALNNKGIRKDISVYIYDRANPTKGILTQVRSVNNLVIEVEHSLNILTSNNLILIPGQMSMEVKGLDNSSKFMLANGSSFDGFFNGQNVMVEYNVDNNNISIVGMLNKINFKDKNQPTSNYNRGKSSVGIPKDTIAKIYSLSYGNYTSRFSGTSAAAPIVTGVAALVLSANPQLNASEIKHILKITATQIGGVAYNPQNDNTKYNYDYKVDDKFGTGRVNAEEAVRLALRWHTDNTVEKPKMCFPNKNINNVNAIHDIWISSETNATANSSNPYNLLNTSLDQNIFIRIRNNGHVKYSFQETDLRVLIAFTNEVNPKFSFPDHWYENKITGVDNSGNNYDTTICLLDVKEVMPIAPGTDINPPISISWKNIRTFLADKGFDPNRHKLYILAHIAPFDGTDVELGIDLETINVYTNKNLNCVEIFTTDSRVSKRLEDGTKVPLNGDKSNLIATETEKQEKFCVDVYNIQATELDTKQFKFSLLDKPNGTVESEVIIKKTNGNWDLSNLPGWLTADIVETESALYAATHKNAEINYALSYDLTKAGKQIQFAVI